MYETQFLWVYADVYVMCALCTCVCVHTCVCGNRRVYSFIYLFIVRVTCKSAAIKSVQNVFYALLCPFWFDVLCKYYTFIGKHTWCGWLSVQSQSMRVCRLCTVHCLYTERNECIITTNTCAPSAFSFRLNIFFIFETQVAFAVADVVVNTGSLPYWVKRF